MKAILVLNDMPNNCEECKIIYLQGHGESSICDSGDWSKRPPWCPLKPLPHKDFEFEAEAYQTEEEYKAYVDGYKDCLEEITGETE